LILVLIRAALVIHIGILIALNPDPEAEMFWCLFLSIVVIDFPVSLCIFALPPPFTTSAYLIAIPILFLGTIQWGIIGIVLQRIVNWFRRGKKANIDDELPVLTVARWTARILGTLLLLLIAVFAIGEGLPNPLILSQREILLFIAMLTMIVGQIAAWKWEGIGGLLIVGGFAFFSIVNHRISINIVFGPWLVMGLIYFGCGWIKRRAASPS